MARHIYSFLFYLSTPLLLLRLLWRSLKAPAYRERIGERFGFSPITPQPNTVWVHCVSVGETLAAAPLIEALLDNKSHYQLALTSTTPTGSKQVERLFGKRVAHCYAPYDLPDCIARFLGHIKPVMVLFVETEVWPNMISLCQQQSIPTALINARMSEKSYRGYKKLHRLSQPMFAALDLVTAQSDADAKRLQSLGAKYINVTGSLKNDFVINHAMKAQASKERQHWEQLRTGDLYCLIAASTHAGEDQIILDAFSTISQQHSNTLLILVPRHPERFDAVYAMSQKAGFVTAKRTDNQLSGDTQVLIGNTMGELQMLFGTADIVIMGGTFIDNGGHNFLEPAAWGLPILSGKSVYNFATISEGLVASQALITVDDQQSLAEQALKLIDQPAIREQCGKAARDYIEANRGAVSANLQALATYLSSK